MSNLTKHQDRKLSRIQYNINYYCNAPVYENSPIITVRDQYADGTVLVSVNNAPNGKWYETRISLWFWITPRGKVTKLKNSDKSIYNKSILQGV